MFTRGYTAVSVRQTMVQSPGTWPFYAILAYKKLSTVSVQWSTIHFQFQLSKYLWIQLYLLRKYDWGMMTRGYDVPSQTVDTDP